MILARVVELNHPLVAHHLSILREVSTPPALFRQQVNRLAMLLAVEATRDLTIQPKTIQTPLCSMVGGELVERIALVPILRAGLGLVEPILQLLPDAETWHLGMYRDERTAEPVEYYCKLPEQNAPEVALVLDPMLATGGSIQAAVGSLKKWGVPHIRVLSVIAAQFGIQRIHETFPDVGIYVCKIDSELNASKFIVPGLGDAGDRIFNTRPQ